MKEILKKNKELIVAIAIVLLLIITGSYAWFTFTKTSDKVNVIKAGTLSMELDDETSDGIKLLNSIPKSYQQGMETTEYTFTLKNNSSVSSSYSVLLNDLDEFEDENGDMITITDDEKIGDNNLRFVLLKNGEVSYPKNSRLLSQDPGRIIDVGVIEGNSEITYSLRIWIDSKAKENIMGKKFAAKIGIAAEQYHG